MSKTILELLSNESQVLPILISKNYNTWKMIYSITSTNLDLDEHIKEEHNNIIT